jgi:hypothetical protein
MRLESYRKKGFRMAVSRYSEESPPPELVQEIRHRLAGVCSAWPQELFEKVTARAAWIEFKYDRALTDTFRASTIRATVGLRYGDATGRTDAPGR